jgi:23S rRNA pseudouridine955/2504/2580 synthase
VKPFQRPGHRPADARTLSETTDPTQPKAVGVQVVDVEPEIAGQRLDNFLLGRLKGAPRSLIYRILRTGQVRVNGGRAKPDTRLAAGDKVRVPPVRLAEPDEPVAAPTSMLSQIEAAIIFEDRHVLVLDKPSGLASHGGSGIRHGAIEAIRELRSDGRLELVHRLDRDTSGLLLFAKSRAALLALQTQMRDGLAQKKYLALIAGRLDPSPFRVEAALRKQVLQGGERMVQVAADGKPSTSVFKVSQRLPGVTLAEVLIETGRTHQIRVHAQHIRHPVAGDPKYGDADFNARMKTFGLKRLFLHAASLKIRGPDEEYLFHAPLPADLTGSLGRLGES